MTELLRNGCVGPRSWPSHVVPARVASPDPRTRGDSLLARFSAGIWNPRGYINQPTRVGSGQLVPAGAYRDRLRSGPGLATRAGTTRPGARA